MAGPEIQRESTEHLPDFESLAEKLADVLSETDNPAMLTVLKNTLKFLDKPDQTKQELNSEEFDRIKTYIEGLKNAPERTQILRDLSTKEDTDPDMKRLVTELLKYLDGKKTIEEAASVETRGAGAGIPISAPPVTSGHEAPESSEQPDRQLEDQLAEIAEAPEPAQDEAPDQTGTESATNADKTDTAKEEESRKRVEHLQNFKEEVGKMSTGELFKKFIDLAKTLPDLLKGLSERLTGGASASTPPYTADQIKEATPDFSRVNEAEPISSDNKSVEYVAKVLNLPSKPSAEEFLAALKQSPNCVFETEKEVSKLKAGDVLFFHDEQEKEKASVTAIVSEAGPPAKMKLVHESENVQEVQIEQSSLLNNWLGYIRMPQSQSGESPA